MITSARRHGHSDPRFSAAYFVQFSPKRTSLFVFYVENGEERYAIVPLLTITSAMTKAEEAKHA